LTFPSAYETWNSAVAEWFFRTEGAGRPAYLSVDEDELPAIAAASGIEPRDALDDFASAVRISLGPAPNAFRPWLRELRTWRSNDTVPPYIGLLALCVVAASRMAADADQQIAANDYYSRLNPLLGLPAAGGMPSGFDEVRRLWRDLDAWLDRDLRGSLGASPVTDPGFFVNIGYPLSQCALRVADRHRLTEFFRSARLQPGDGISDGRLLILLKAWAARPSAGLTSVGRNAIIDAEPGGLRATAIVSVAQRELAMWNGELRDVHGRQRAECVVILTMRRNQVTGAKIFAPRPEGFPEEAVWDGPGGHREIAAAAAGWYSEIPRTSVADVLDSGLSLTHGRFAITWQPAPLVVFGRTFVPESGWISQRQVTLREEHLLLARHSLRPEVVEFLRRHAGHNASRPASLAVLPGWDIYTGVTIGHVAQERIPDGLEPLVPRLNTSTHLEGGLMLSPGVYLSGGEPDLHISVGKGEHAAVRIDDESERLKSGTLTLRLREHHLGEGAHEVVAGGRTVRFSTVRSFGGVEPDHAGELAQVLEKHGAYQPRSVFATDGAAGPPAGGTVEICGADVDAALDDLPVRPRPPVVLRSRFLKYELVGAVPGELQTVREPGPPGWLMSRVDTFQFFEIEPEFDPQLLILTGHEPPAVKLLASPPLPPSTETTYGPERLCAWVDALLSIAHTARVSADLADIWADYIEAARQTTQVHQCR
jgi:hypothetical protein